MATRNVWDEKLVSRDRKVFFLIGHNGVQNTNLFGLSAYVHHMNGFGST
jgi:hypothetical protein